MKRFGLILVILLVGIFLTGCNIIITAPDCCTPPVPSVESCTLTVTAGYWVWGIVKYEILSTGEIINTEQYIDYDGVDQVVIKNMPCGEVVDVYVKDLCGPESHRIRIYIKLGNNIVNFPYW